MDAALDAGTPKSVSARDYGFVRPAAISQSDNKARLLAGGADLWTPIRRDPGLGIQPHPKILDTARRLASKTGYLNGLNQRARPYLSLILSELQQAGLPATLALLPEIESGYNPRAVSPKKAVGLWQFMPETAREFGLKSNARIDERTDVTASTRSAIAYLRYLHKEFDGDWALALASYNAGPNRVRRAMERNAAKNLPTDFWSLQLPRETREYVPRLLAVAELIRAPQRYGLETLAMNDTGRAPRLALVTAR